MMESDGKGVSAGSNIDWSFNLQLVRLMPGSVRLVCVSVCVYAFERLS